ncbi:MAG TPA: hypothetical protein DCG75_07505 [Bacteroidales bacterium]|nr:hypothetical protein [Bacteroidales bacterium]
MSQTKNNMMIRNYFKTALRILTRNKVFSIINILGLSLALTCVIVIFLFIMHELSFDKYHSNYDSIYRIVSNQIQNGTEHFDETVPYPLSGVLKSELTGQKDVTQIYFANERLLKVGDDKYLERGVLYVDSNFVKVFDIEFLIGSPDKLNDPNSIFLTEAIALKYFGSNDEALNKNIVIHDSVTLNVAGILKNPPKNTHIPFQAMLSIKNLKEEYFNFGYDSWGTRSSGFATYLTLKNESNFSDMELKIQEIVDKHNPNDEEAQRTEFFILQPLSDVHYDDRFGSFNGTYVLSKKLLFIFASVGLFIILIAFINFTNLSIVQTIKRAREVGIRKVLGANRLTLIKQFLGETFLILLIAEIIAVIFTEIILSKINTFLGSGTELKMYGNFSVIIFLVIILALLTFLSGIYPATVLSRYNPIRALRYNMKLGKAKSFSLYNLLVFLQFFISQILIVSTIVISLQLDYFRNKDMGFYKKNIIMIDLPGYEASKAKVMIDLLESNPDIEKVSLGIGSPLSGSNITSSFQRIEDLETDYHANMKTVDTSYFSLYGLKLIAGTWSMLSQENDSTFNIVVNKTLIKKIGIENPSDAIEQYLFIFGKTYGKITGVVEDFNTYTLHSKIPPVIFVSYEDFFTQIHIRTNEKHYSEVKDFIEKCWDQVYPQYVYSYDIFEDSIQRRYKSEQRMSQITKTFTFIAIIIACLGLFGLVSYMLVQRTKEIGIRKALGASAASVILLVTKQFISLVVISCIFAWPAAYYLMRSWLNNYAYKIELSVWIFILSGAALILITFLTILYQSIKVSNTKPADVLKYE